MQTYTDMYHLRSRFPMFSKYDFVLFCFFSQKENNKRQKNISKDTVQNNYSWILKSADACNELEIQPSVDL